jgi:ABC-type transport system involved in multi-copper enzyme maturation permease subunit
MYQSIRDNGTYYTFLGGILGFVLMFIGIMEEVDNIGEMTGSKYMTYNSNSIILLLMALVFTVRICGSDISDKTINNEMLTGTKRSKIYAGRVIISLFYVMISYALFFILPIVIFGAVNGWGFTMPLREGVIRLSLEIVPLIRFTAIIACFVFATLNPLAVALIGFMLIMGEAMIVLIADELGGVMQEYLLPFLTMAELSEIENYNFTLGYIDGKDVEVLGNGIASGTIATIAIAGTIAAVLYFIIGYAIFGKKDMD